MGKFIRAFVIVCAFFAHNVTIAAGGNVSGSVTGTVVDSDANPIAQAEVVIVNESTGLKRTVVTDANGRYSIKAPTGTYSISSSKSGFVSDKARTIVLALGGETKMPLVMGSNNESAEEVYVLGSRLAPISSRAITGVSFSSEDVQRIPVPRTIEDVALLAPGAVAGDTAFGDDRTLASIGGASVAENTYYINGMNVTNFRNGLGGSSVPFEFYSDFEIKTGGYSAEFGRSTGGVINAVTKHGDNEFHYGFVGYYEPDSLRSDSPNTYFENGQLYDNNAGDEGSEWTTDFYVSGPIIQDKLFFYALYEPRKSKREYTTRGNLNQPPTTHNEESSDDDFYGLDLLWNITDEHVLNLTHFSDERTIETEIYGDYDPATDSHGPTPSSTGFELRGGDNTILRYDGVITDSFNLSVMAGLNEYDLTDTSSQLLGCPNVINSNADNINIPFLAGCARDFVLADIGGDERKAFRIDAEWNVGDHLIRFGLDREVNTTALTSTYPAGGLYYRYYSFAPGTVLRDNSDDPAVPDDVVPDLNGDVTRLRFLESGGEFETEANAFYIEDIWQVNESLELRLGLRSETFNNKNGDGESFIEIKNQIAPRLGVEYDFSNGSGDSVLYSTWGRYHLPIANNTNARLSGAELFTETWFVYEGPLDPVTDVPTAVDANGIPTADVLSPLHFFSDGSIPDTGSIVDSTIDPMFQDEFIIGYRHRLEDWNFTVNYINRELSSTIDDILVSQTGEYVLTNPGTDITVDVDGTPTTFTADQLGFPEASREYQALQFEFERIFDGKWSLQGSYTYSKSEGNTEGLVKSDNGQDDAGLTTDFDFPELMDGAFGRLANDRPHQLKIWGNYQAMENLRLGALFRYTSGRPRNKFGFHGHPDGDTDYGQTYYTLENGEYVFNPRGSQGRTSAVSSLDFNAVYNMTVAGGDLELRVDVFNVFNQDAETQVFEDAEDGAPGSADPRFFLPTAYQDPRSVRFGVALRF